MHEALEDEDYSQIISDLKEDHKEVIYFLYLRDFTTMQLAALRNQSDRNIRGVRSTIMLTDENSSLKVCKHCGKAFVATRSNMEFDTPQCENQYNVYKSRAKKNDTP